MGANVAVSSFCKIIQCYLKSIHCSLNVLHSHIKCFTFASSGFMKDFFLSRLEIVCACSISFCHLWIWCGDLTFSWPICCVSLKLIYFTEFKLERLFRGHWSKPCIWGKRIFSNRSVKTCSSWMILFLPLQNSSSLFRTVVLNAEKQFYNQQQKLFCFYSLG